MRVDDVEVPRAGKPLFPGGITKSDLAGYYRDVADAMLPYVADRPIAMERYPDGIDGQRLFQKNVPDYFPDWITRVEVPKADGTVRQAICDQPATLVYLAGQACITPHVFLSRADRLDHPDQLIFDLDPPDANAGQWLGGDDPWAGMFRRARKLHQRRQRLADLEESEQQGGRR